MLIHAKISDADLPREHYHALLCDPPYHLGPTGFMGKAWDKDGPDAVAFNPATWARLAESLLPGAFGMAFASSRGWHRLAVAIEDAGLIIHPSIFAWAFGSGFPKATNISVAVDKIAGAERPVVGVNPGWRPNSATSNSWREAEGREAAAIGSPVLTAPATPLAAAWEGHRYGLQAMKPAIEPIILFQKPYRGKPLDCITSTGAGALNIDGGRIGFEDTPNPATNPLYRKQAGYANGNASDTGSSNYSMKKSGLGERTAVEAGRWPANFVLDEEAARRLDLQSGESTSGMDKGERGKGGIWGDSSGVPCGPQYGDTGGASRFFHTYGWNHEVEERIEDADPAYYSGKAGQMERNAGLQGQNFHPCVKPIDLTKWLASLLLPPVDYAPRRLLVPFAGSGSEMIGGYLAGWEEVTGIEMTEEYIPITKARIKFWRGWGKGRKPQGFTKETVEAHPSLF